ncbi:hypothetical protein M3Y95_00923300 [Aphelenchoides besseyi]|nr:hypothetical protein M3Y95_00923300 [Aphelenchoides besseyi]
MRLFIPLLFCIVLVVCFASTGDAKITTTVKPVLTNRRRSNRNQQPKSRRNGHKTNGHERRSATHRGQRTHIGADGRQVEEEDQHVHNENVKDCRKRSPQLVGRDHCTQFIADSCPHITEHNVFSWRPEFFHDCVSRFCESKESRCEGLAGIYNTCGGKSEPLKKYGCA